jgi:wyosine [tRNA(Phe)-imidazoG37] synthetase (radical SAM superfamily)
MNHAHPEIRYRDILNGLNRLDRFVVQTMFVQGAVDNTGDADIADWIMMLNDFQPRWVQIYSLDRGSANQELAKVSRSRLNEIAQRAREDTKLSIEVY